MSETNSVVISNSSSNSSPLNPPSRTVCHVCHKQFSQYTCPRCNSRYCSLHCYKSHSLRCTESFMRENVVEELRLMQPEDESKQKMLDILKRFHSQEEMESMDEDDCHLSEETVQKVLSGDSMSFEDLSAEEKIQFQRAVASGKLSKLIQPWNPWWLKPSARTISLSKEGTQLVQPLVEQEASASSQDDGAGEQSSEIPPGPEAPLTPVKKLISTKPSPLLAVHLVDIMYSYCFTLRLYNGDWQSDAIGSVMVALSVSYVLDQGGQTETVMEVLCHCLEQTCSPDYRHIGGLQFGLGIINDVISIISLGGPALICALCDLQRLFQAGERELKAEKLRKSRRAEIRSKLKLGERKIYFLMCWVHEQPREAWSPLSNILQAERSKVMEYSNSKNHLVKYKNPECKNKALIEEMK
ncbi:zinc finger HIT domain-containing protein 2 [Ricinus communis]|uniref:Zinc finger protein, putative n=1 Tax=Ricinus communis TaxID=3988 RepID=B9RYR9_RICCO|nr:zinc finger HIT domain-containing protein 2 [Ricinus communis]EEF43421.1 zinc finger protein, putative [Ricinus communis]|eukprot:XP_002518888.1 zinc finger HIT domain-containing protein 2 [Ricinus communis]